MQLDKYLGYNRNKLGIHHQPTQYHEHVDLTYFFNKYQDMGMSFCVVLDDGGGSTLKPNRFTGRSVIEELHVRDIIPVVRIYAPANARLDMRMEETVGRLVGQGVRYVFWVNEPEISSVEWGDQGQPRNWVEVVMRNFVEGAYKIIALGGYPGTPAFASARFFDPDGKWINPFLAYMSASERDYIFGQHGGWVSIHNYALHRGVDYPNDDVNMYGTHLTHEEYLNVLSEVDETYRRETGRLWTWENWETSEHHINLQRDQYKNPNASIFDDDACFRMYELMNHHLDDAEIVAPLISTECGPSVGDKAKDGRYPRVTPKRQIEMIKAQLEVARRVPNYFAMCFWVAGVKSMAAERADGFEPNAWWTTMHDQPFNLNGEMSIVNELIRLNKESMPMKSKLFFHVQNPRDYALNAIRDSQPEYIKVMGNALNPDKIALIRQYAPNAKLIGRYHLDNQSYDNPEHNAAWLVDEIAKTGCGPLMWAWESYNEIAVSTLNTEQVRNLDHFFAAFHRLIKQRFGVEHSIVINSPTGNLGWPNEVSPADFTESLSLNGTIASFHCYEYHQAPANDREAHLFRWKRLVDQVLSKFPNKEFLLTEVGITELALGQPHPDVGWSYRGAYSEQEYMKVLYDLDVEMCKYPAVIGACVFQTGCNDDWLAAGFESSEQVKKHRVSFIPPQPVFTNPIRVKRTKLGIIEILELEEYLRGVVPGEMFPTWPIEALKAQAIAARSYAMANIRDRKNQPYDVDDTTNFQVYAPDLIHPNTDLAIRETKGVHILRNGRVILAEYKAHCGRSICVNCKGQNYQVWEGQLCQYGSRDLAQTGKKYAEILRTYYGQDIVLSNEEAIPEEPEMPKIPTWTLTKDPQSDYFAVGTDGKVVASIANIKAHPETDEWAWRVREIDFINEAEAKGDINIYVYLEDEYGNPCDEEVQFAWPSSRLDGPYDGSVTVMSLVEKVASFTMGGGNFFPQKSTDYGPYLVKVLGLPSDTVYGFGLPGNRHVAWKVTFRKARKLHVPEEQPEEPVPTDPPTEEEIRNELWNHPISVDVIPYNPEHAFPKKARENNLGAPLGNTWDWRGLRLQKYAMGNLYCVVGDWQNIKVIKY